LAQFCCSCSSSLAWAWAWGRSCVAARPFSPCLHQSQEPRRILPGLYELHLATDSPATTGAEVNITASLVASDNGSLVLPTDPHSYRFHWVHSPLMLKGKTEEAFRSTIRAVGNVPGDFPIAVWVTSADCQMCQPVARSRLVLSITGGDLSCLLIGLQTLGAGKHRPGCPPLTMCWRIKSECLPLEEHECRPVSVASTVYNVTTIIMDPGDYCFSIRAENVISRTHQYHRVQVWPSRMQPAVFAFPCATIITMMLAFIMYMTLRNTTQQKDMVEVADFDFSPMSDKNPEPPTEAKCCQMCCVPFLLESPSEYLEVVRENHGLLPPLYKSVKTYTV
ncbi:transmembrane protein 130, partial [Myotis lucifugus]|uniref:transmembrane protein 130 n=1 Tax=Myotis lucifugus TaxID=59463 RepID=UPI000CCC2AD4